MQKEQPFYLKTTIILFGLTLSAYALYNMKDVLVPLALALMLAILLNPLTNWLQRKKLSQVWSIIISLFIAIVSLAAIIYFLSSQIASFGAEFPILKKKFAELLANAQQAVRHNLNIPIQKQEQYLNDAQKGLNPLLGKTLGTVLGSLAIIVLLPIYTFLFLYYKTLILNFLYEVFAEKNSKEVAVVLSQTKGAIQSYMVGLLLEALVVATLNVLALWALGVDYALLLGVLGAILNILPYIGGLIAIALPVLIATVTKDGYNTQIGIIIAYLVIQFIDNNFLVPMIVSSKVKINALISLVIVLLGGALWDIPGMFLSIPFIAVLKIIFDRVPELKSWGKLLGDEIPTKHKGQIWNRGKKQAVGT